MRTIGLDVGDRRIGVAVSDPEGRIAVPLRTYQRRGAGDVAALARLAHEEDAGRIVVGLPLSLDGSRGAQAEVTAVFADELRAAADLDVVLWDERFSSAEADHHLRASGRPVRQAQSRRGKSAKEARDAVAASIILQAYLDSQRLGALPPVE